MNGIACLSTLHDSTILRRRARSDCHIGAWRWELRCSPGSSRTTRMLPRPPRDGQGAGVLRQEPSRQRSRNSTRLKLIPDASAEEDERYVKIGEMVAEAYHIEDQLQTFVSQYGLAGKKALDVGSGRGYLAGRGRRLHRTRYFAYRRAVLSQEIRARIGDVDAFEAGSFDVVWSIDVLEHVPNPEQALREIRRAPKMARCCIYCPRGTANHTWLTVTTSARTAILA